MDEVTWKCPKCGYTMEEKPGTPPPQTCPGCKEKCEFVNVSCYIPDCGGSGQDPRLG